jgi:hypothetical protein
MKTHAQNGTPRRSCTRGSAVPDGGSSISRRPDTLAEYSRSSHREQPLRRLDGAVWATDVDPSKKPTSGGLIAPLNAQADALWDAQPLDGMPTAVLHVLDNRHLRLAPSSIGWRAPKRSRRRWQDAAAPSQEDREARAVAQ